MGEGEHKSINKVHIITFEVIKTSKMIDNLHIDTPSVMYRTRIVFLTVQKCHCKATGQFLQAPKKERKTRAIKVEWSTKTHKN